MTTTVDVDSLISEARSLHLMDGLMDHMFGLLSENKKEKIPRIARDRTRYLTLITENIRGEQNASAILRTAEGLGIQDVHLIESQYTAGVNQEISKGTRRWLDVHRHPISGQEAAIWIKQRGYTLVATVPENEGIPFDQIPIDRPMALLLGNEQEGITKEIIPLADIKVTIPMFGFVESFNVSVAAGIMAQDLITRIRKELPPERWRLTSDERRDLMLKWAIRSIRNGDSIANHWIQKNR
ncbi:MAG: RNA methyltransferase [Bacteroidota bacterium]|nr:RNA methyltransferase [Bacteroidota bacterium]